MNAWRTNLLRSAGVLALLACFLVGVVAVEAWRARHDDPLVQPEYVSLMAEVVERPADQALRERLRTVDRELRTLHVERAERLRRGAWAIAVLGGLAVLAVAIARLGRIEPYDPRGQPPPDPWRGAAAPRLGVLGAAVMIAGGWSLLGRSAPTALPAVVVAPASAADFARNWPCFRGPRGDGSTATPWPATPRERWRVPAGLPGTSSPIVWDGGIYLTGGDAQRQTVTAFDAATGAQRWQTSVPFPPGAKPEPFEDTGYAAPTPVTDGRQVVAVFASGALVALDCLDGKTRWQKQLGVPTSMYSFAASLAIWQDRVLLQWDVDDEGKSALTAFGTATGRELWRTRRELPAAWSSPILARLGGREVVLCAGNPRLAAYDPANGAELWHADLFHGDVGPSPIVVGDRAIFANARNLVAALQPDGSTAWKSEDGLPDTVSPVSDGTQVALISDGGMLTAFAVADGAKAWEQDLSGSFKASPLVHGSDLLLFGADGQGRRVTLGASCTLGEPWSAGGAVAASPAVVDGRLYVRTAEHLVCYEAAP